MYYSLFREAAFLCAVALIFLQGPFLNASYFPLAQSLNRPLTDVVLASGYNLLAAGCSGPIVCALSRKYGKRPVFLVSTLLDIIGTAVGEARLSFNYLLAARIIQGFSTSAFESLIIAVVGDMYFVHERGLRIAVINFILNSASSLASIICGQVYADLGYYWLFHMFQIFLVVQFIAMFLFCPESTFIREEQYETDVAADEKLEESAVVTKSHYREEEHQSAIKPTASSQTQRTIPAKKTFVQELAVYTHVYAPDNILKYLFGPFITILNPGASYAVFASGLLNSWYVGSAIILSGVFAGPPWNFGAAQVGYLGAGPFVGGMIGSIVAAWLSDPVIKYMGKKNKGI
jgi:MFS family permease